MWIQVRSMDGQKNVRIDDLSKLTKIEDLRAILVAHFNAEPERQRLFFRGKQVSNSYHCDVVACINYINITFIVSLKTDTHYLTMTLD